MLIAKILGAFIANSRHLAC